MFIQTYKVNGMMISAVQLRWATWNDVCDLVGDIISEDNPARMSHEPTDTCGEAGPDYIEFTLPHEVPSIVHHGDWLLKHPNGLIHRISPRDFADHVAPYEVENAI